MPPELKVSRTIPDENGKLVLSFDLAAGYWVDWEWLAPKVGEIEHRLLNPPECMRVNSG